MQQHITTWRRRADLEHAIAEYKDKIQALTDADLEGEAKDRIWLSAYAHNNPKSDYHWQADAVYDECQRRKRPDIYETAFNRARASL